MNETAKFQPKRGDRFVEAGEGNWKYIWNFDNPWTQKVQEIEETYQGPELRKRSSKRYPLEGRFTHKAWNLVDRKFFLSHRSYFYDKIEARWLAFEPKDD